MQHFTIHHDGVTIPVSRGGRGRPLVLCPGLCSTQADLHELIELLWRDHNVVSFDLRGHGRATAADRSTFEAFRCDLGERLVREQPRIATPWLGADHGLVFASEIAQIIRRAQGRVARSTSG